MSVGGARTGIPPFPTFRLAKSFRWGNPADEIRLLELVKNDDEFIYAFCARAVTRPPRLHAIAQRLCLEFVASDKYFHTYAKKTGMIEQIDGSWKATEKWTTRIANPVRTKLRSLIETYNKAQEKYERFIKPDFTRLAQVPVKVRGDLAVDCPHFFLIKELRDPVGPARVPRVGTPAPGPARQVRRRIEITNRPIHRSLPSPSPSEASRSPSPTAPDQPLPPSISLGPAPTGPFNLRLTPSLARPQSSKPLSAPPRIAIQQNAIASSSRLPIQVESSSSSSGSSGSISEEEPNSHVSSPRVASRQNAVASSSRLPINVESSSDSSSSMSGSDSDESSYHEMENDYVKEAAPMSASPEKRDWLSLGPAGRKRSPSISHRIGSRGNAETDTDSTCDSDPLASSDEEGTSIVMTQNPAGTRHKPNREAVQYDRGSPAIGPLQADPARHAGAESDFQNVDNGVPTAVATDTAGVRHDGQLDARAQRHLKRIGERLRAAVDDSPMLHAAGTPRAILAFPRLYKRYTDTVDDNVRDRLVYEAQSRLLCQAMRGMETYLVVPKFLQGCLIHFNAALHSSLHDRVAQLEHFAEWVGATLCGRRALYSAGTYKRRIIVSLNRLGFENKTHLVKKGDSTYTIYQYSLLAFGLYCSVQLGDIASFPTL